MAGFTKSEEQHRARMAGAEDASHSAAALQYFCHVAALGEFLIKPIGFGDATGDGSETETKRRGKILSMINTDDCTPAAFIRTVLRKTKRLSAEQTKKVTFALCSEHPYCGRVNNIEIAMNSNEVGTLGYAVRSLHDDCFAILRMTLMQNFNLPVGIWDMILSFSDNISEREPGYFFGSRGASGGKMEEWASKFLVHLTTQSNSIIKREKKNGADAISLTRDAAAWLRSADKLTELLYILFHICCGGPPRVTEMSGIRLRNTTSGKRNLYLYNGSLAVLTCYSKTSMQYEKARPIARFLDSTTTEIALCYITFIKPIQSFLLRSLAGDEKGTSHFMFCQGGEKLGDDKACKAFRDRLGERGVPLTISLYRHYQTGTVKYHMRELAGISADNIAFVQAGHTESTANRRYAQVEFDFEQFNTATFAGFQRASQRWRQLLGLCQTSKALQCFNSVRVHPRDGEMRDRSKEKEIRERLPKEIGECRLRIKDYGERVNPVSADDQNRERDACEMNENVHLSAVRQSSGRKRVSFQEDPSTVQERSRKYARTDAAECVRKLLGRSSANAVFRSEAQRAATHECVMHGVCNGYENSMLVVLPTGGGKTVCWASPALQEQLHAERDYGRRRVTLLVVPLVSLQQDMLRRCGEYGLNAGLWDHRFKSDVSVVICPIDKVSTA